jgi:hypothetical protein
MSKQKSSQQKHDAILNSFADHADSWQEWCECAGMDTDSDNDMDQVEDVLNNGLNSEDIDAIYKCLQENGII